jgi:predicted ATPase/class 3 adenylate cyclase
VELPSGAVTLLFTDIEGSTRWWEIAPEMMRVSLERHDDLVRDAIERCGGRVFKTVGDGFCAAFADASSALEAAIRAQRAMAAEPWPDPVRLRVRIGLHTGSCYERDGDYFGPVVSRVARLEAAAHGGQVVASAATAALLGGPAAEGVELVDLGLHRLKDLGLPEQIYAVLADGLEREFPSLRTLDNAALRHNLPEQLSEFVGRDMELAETHTMLLESRLLTLVGAGGAGKTRLALQLAAELLDGTGDGVWLVELAPISEPALVALTVASVLGIRAVADRTMADVLVDALAHQDLLLVLDNCEQVIDTCAELAAALLRSCPRVHILATSREPLGVEGERVFRVPSLALAPEGVLAPAELLRYGAVRLFAERAVRQQPGFVLDASNAADVVALCRELDGMPLAIELATARLRSMSLSQIRARLDERFRLLVGSTRSAPARQQTLRATVDWSYGLLSPDESWALGALSVFAGGFDLEAGEAVCAEQLDAWDTADVLRSLVDKSLVQADASGNIVRFSMLETIRHYAAERLAEQGRPAVSAIQARHAQFFVELGEDAAGALRGPDQARWVGRLEPEQANLRIAFNHLLDDPDGGADALRLGTALRWFWQLQGGMVEGSELLIAALARPDVQGRDALRARALFVAGTLLGVIANARATAVLEEGMAIAREIGEEQLAAACARRLGWAALYSGDLAAADAHAAASVEIAERLADPLLLGDVLDLRATCRRYHRDPTSAQADYTEAITLFRRAGDRHGIAGSLINLAIVEIEERNLPAARAHLEEAHQISAEMHGGGTVSTVILANLGHAAILAGDASAAADHYLAGLIEARRVGMPLELAYALLGVALCARVDGEHELAAALHGASSALTDSLGVALDPLEAGMQERDLAVLRVAMGAEFQPAYAAGRELELEAAIALARSAPTRSTATR